MPNVTPVIFRRFVSCFLVLGLSLLSWVIVHAQTSSTGAITGVVVDSWGNPMTGVFVQVSAPNDPHASASSVSDKGGSFGFASLHPGTYQLQASKADFQALAIQGLHVHVTEILHLEIRLHLATVFESMQVFSNQPIAQLDTAALGRTTNERAIQDLPLVTRNFSQLAGLSPGVAAGIFNAGELGTGGTALSQISSSNDGIFVHGSRSYDNNWQLDGLSVSDVLSTSTASGGIPIPNPDALAEFKVQTGVYDAAFGRAAGSNISVITKAGTNHLHATFFEFLRNDILNANDYFLRQSGQRRPTLKQNQFGLALGGPLHGIRLLFFGSYQGTRQVNGVAAGQARLACSATLFEPLLTNDRSPAALGSLFGGMSGALGGIAIAPDGSNINPVAVALLNFKLPDGRFLVPTPQKIDHSRPFASQGFSTFSDPCHFRENQFLANLDYEASQKSRFSTRFFYSRSNQSVTFPGNGKISFGNIAGFGSQGATDFLVFSVAHTYALSSIRLNQARIGFVRTRGTTGANAPFAWSDVGVSEGAMNKNNDLPSLQIVGSVSMAPALPRTYTQNTFVIDDVFTTIYGSHALQIGGSISRMQDPIRFAGFDSFIQFLSWPDFLLGMSARGNGTGRFSNVFQSADGFGLFDRDFRALEVSGFLQDDYRIKKSLTLNLGIRYERPGQFGDSSGKSASFDLTKADRNPPPQGSLDGYLIASNFPGSTPPGVTQVNNSFGTYAHGQNTVAPRVGFAWQVSPRTSRFVVRGGYGFYYSRPTGQAFTASVLAAPFGLTRTSIGGANTAATLQAPFAQPFPSPSFFPMFPPYRQGTNISVNVLSPNFRPAMVQQFTVNTQATLQKDWVLELGYVGTRGTRLQRFRSLNQALSASQENPIRGVTSNTVANIPLRVPIPGIIPDSLRVMESAGNSWYNALEASLAKRLSHGFQFLASYTFSKVLDTDGANINGTSGVNSLTLGDQNSAKQRRGRASFDRTHRLVLSETWDIPASIAGVRGLLLREWAIAVVLTVQSGTALTIADTNANNVFGISEDRAQLSGLCSNQQLLTKGSTRSKLASYFNRSCFTSPPLIGADGLGTGFGDSATGIVDGPRQASLDIAVSRYFGLNWPTDRSTLQVRVEFYNSLNHPQFSNPDSNFTSPTFGVISSTSVNPRVGQLGLKFEF